MSETPRNVKFLPKENLVELGFDYLKYDANYFITLNAFSDKTSKEFIETSFHRWGRRMNKFCYGRRYLRNEANLKIVGGLERGDYEDKWHIHCALGHGDDCWRCVKEISDAATYHWYDLINAKGRKGNLVDVRPIYDLEGALDYSFWDSTKHQRISGEYGVMFV